MTRELTTIEGHHPATLSSQAHWLQLHELQLVNWDHTQMVHLARPALVPALQAWVLLGFVSYRQMVVASEVADAGLRVGAYLVALPVVHQLQVVAKDLGGIEL